MAVKNAQANLPAAINSVSDLVDEVVVAVDTSSTDATKETAESLGARVFDFKWVDSFAVARNEPIEQARGDWILWLDGDEWVDDDNRRPLKKLVDSLSDENIGYVMRSISVTRLPFPTPGQEHFEQVAYQVRVFRRHPAIRWQLRVFEQIRPSVRLAGGTIRDTDIIIRHTGLDDAETIRQKAQRNLRLALLQDAEWPDDPYNLMYIGESLIYLGRLLEAVAYLEKSVALFPPAASALGKAISLLSAARHHLDYLP